VNLTFSNIKSIAKTVEIYENTEKDMFAGVRTSFKAQMKIIKETYGS